MPVTSILHVAFNNVFEKNDVERHLRPHLKSRAKFKVDEGLFTWRVDWKYWSNTQETASVHVGTDVDDDIPF